LYFRYVYSVRIGLTGGIGSGKSAVARRFVELGAVVVDADALAREVVEPGTPGLSAVIAEFGADVVSPNGAIDRAALAAIVFNDAKRRVALEAIIHPLVRERSQALIDEAASDAVVVYDVPLLAEQVDTATDRRDEFDLILVVEAPEALRLDRLEARGVSRVDAERRMANQATDAQRRDIADVVIVNDDSIDVLNATVDDLWWGLFGDDDQADDDDLDGDTVSG
jgi:dephospho-CoA kinase